MVDIINANIKVHIPIIAPSTQNIIFMIIKNFNPSQSNEKIIPGNLMDQEATSLNTSLIQDAEKIQYNSDITQ